MYDATAAIAAMNRKVNKNTQKYIKKIKRAIWWTSHNGLITTAYFIKKKDIIDKYTIMAYFSDLGYDIAYDNTIDGLNYFLIKWNQKKGDNE